ncbi:MAG: hypothetical protein WCH99_19235 [Verrucomicrobiota bacterium]
MGDCRRRMTVSLARFTAQQAWPFFDIWILSRSPFWVAGWSLPPSPGSLETFNISFWVIFGNLW